MRVTRRHILTGFAGLSAAALAGCSGSQAPATPAPSTPVVTTKAAAWPVDVKHVYGTTTIAKAPERVATISWVNADIVVALGVVPVGMDKDTWGANAAGSTDWKDAKLAELGAAMGTAKAPTQFDTANGINFDAISELTPDLIIGAYSGMTKQEYDKLTKIAPVIGPGVAAYQTPWQQSTEMIAAALGKQAEGKALVADTLAAVKKAGVEAHPEFATVTAIAGNLEPAVGGINIYTAGDSRSRFLELLGLPLASFVTDNAKPDEFFFNWSAERANEITSDIFFTWLPTGTTADDIAKHPLFGQIPAVKKGGLVVPANDAEVLAISAASPLSLAWSLDKVVPKFVAAVTKVKGA